VKKIFSFMATLALLATLASCGGDSGTTAGDGTSGDGTTVSASCVDTSSTSSLPSCVRTDMSYE